MQGSNSGFNFSTDPRNKNFAFSTVSATRPPIPQKDWWADGWWGNQGSTPYCCAYSWVHVLEDGPVVQDAIQGRSVPLFTPDKFYKQCKLIDGLPASSDGTTILAGAQVAKKFGLISEYRWANTVDEVVDALLIFGPVIAGTHWYDGMNAESDGTMRIRGRLQGGHAYVLNGVDTKKQVIRVKNSYGKTWGKQGYGYLSFESLDKLLKDGGEICVPFEKKLSKIPTL